MKIIPAIGLLIAFHMSIPVLGSAFRVPDDYPTIQAGLDACLYGDIVLVADGIYSGEGNQDFHFSASAVTLMSENGRDHCTIDLQGCQWGFRIYESFKPGPTIQGFTIINGSPTFPPEYDDGGVIYCEDAYLTILDCTFVGNSTPGGSGGAIYSKNSTALIKGNYFSGNWCEHIGGAIAINGGTPLIVDNIFQENEALLLGGAISCEEGDPQIINNLFLGNEQYWQDNDQGGGAIACISGSTATITNCTFAENIAQGNGGGGAIFVDDNGTAIVTNSILWGNTPDELGEVSPGTITINFSCISGGWEGMGNLDLDPLFATGPAGQYYLSQIAAGQGDDSPCVDAGDPLAELTDGTTRTDLLPDDGIVDMGFHYPFRPPQLRLVSGPGPGEDNPALVRVHRHFYVSSWEYEFSAYGALHDGTKVTCGDVDGDAIDEIITGPGPGEIYGPHVRGFSRAGIPIPGLSYMAYGTNKYGVNVAAGDLDGDGRDEIITGAGPGAVFGPHVRGWSYNGASGVTPFPGVNYFAYGTPKWGVNVSAGDIDGDGYDEIVTGAGPGAVYGPHVRGWNVDGGSAVAIPGVSYFAYGTLKYGVNVSAGDVDGDGFDEIITGAGPGSMFLSHVRGWNFDGTAVTPLPGFSFFAWNDESWYFGVNVFVGADLDGDGSDDLVTGRGPDSYASADVKGYTYDGATVSQLFSLWTFSRSGGVNVASGSF